MLRVRGALRPRHTLLPIYIHAFLLAHPSQLLWWNSRVGQSALKIENALPHFLLRDLRLAIYRDSVTAVPELAGLSFFPLKEICLLLRAEVFLVRRAVTRAAPK
jgi:hypothetical protein